MVKKKDHVLDLETRKNIYDHVCTAPGSHFREIQRRLKISSSVVEYHLKYLEDRDMIVARKETRYKRYYIAGKIGAKDKSFMSILRQKVPRQIVLHVLLNPGTSHKDLREMFAISPSTLSFHLQKLLKNEIIKQVKDGRANTYWVINEDDVADVLVRYQRGFIDPMVDSFVETWLEIHL